MNDTTLTLRTWLTSRRLRVHGLLIGLVLWTVYAWVLATPSLRDRNGLLKGTDFLHFYTLGTLALEHRGADLYDMKAESALAQQRVPQAGHLVYVSLYGPQVSLLFAPLAMLPYAWALTLWLTATVVIYGFCCYEIWKSCSGLQPHPWTAFILVAAYPAFVHLIVWGQNSALALACFTGAYFAFRARNFWVAGLALGCLMFKPQLALAAFVVFVLTRQWRVVAGIFVAAVAQVALGWLYYGTSPMKEYVHQFIHVRSAYPLLEPRPYHMHSLHAFWAMLIPWPYVAFTLYVVSAMIVLALTVRYWGSAAPLGLRFSALLVATVLVSPHLTVYDLVILVPAFLLLADWSIAHHQQAVVVSLGSLLYLCYALPLTVPVTQWSHVQLSVPAMVALLWVVQGIRDDETPLHAAPSAA